MFRNPPRSYKLVLCYFGVLVHELDWISDQAHPKFMLLSAVRSVKFWVPFGKLVPGIFADKFD